MFSPYYAWSRRFGAGDPLRHCCLNVALYGTPRRWAMTERGAAQRSASELTIGRSTLHWDNDALTFHIVERTPLRQRLRGTVKVHPAALTGQTFPLDAAAQHRWSPLAPRAHVEVALQEPALTWSGPGYFDTNDGDVPLEQSFARWTWSRANLADSTAILYEVATHKDSGAALALQIDRAGGISHFTAPPTTPLPPTRWRVARETRSTGAAQVRKTLEDTPFYARSVLSTELLGQRVEAMHESLSLDRFRLPLVQAMLPFKMPRASR